MIPDRRRAIFIESAGEPDSGTGLGFGSDFDRSDGSAPLSDSERFDKSVCFLVLFSRRR